MKSLESSEIKGSLSARSLSTNGMMATPDSFEQFGVWCGICDRRTWSKRG
jgi:hypothetical protein